MMYSLDLFEPKIFELPKVEVAQNLERFNRSFETKVRPEKGIFGMTETLRNDGGVERIGINEQGFRTQELVREGQVFHRRERLGNGRELHAKFNSDGKMTMQRERLSNGSWIERNFDANGKLVDIRQKQSDKNWQIANVDDNGKIFSQTTVHKEGLRIKERINKLAPNSTFVKNGIEYKTDRLGRVVEVFQKEVQVMEPGTARKSLNHIDRHPDFKTGDQKGHIIAHKHGGDGGSYNIFAQDGEHNNGIHKSNESRLTKLAENKENKMSQRIKLKYSDDSARPTAVEQTFYNHGEKIETHRTLNRPESEVNVLTKTKARAGEFLQNGKEIFHANHDAALKSGLLATAITGAISVVDNTVAVISGEVAPSEAVANVLQNTATAGALGYGTTFISSAVAKGFSESSHALIKSLGTSGVTGAAISFGIRSYDAVVEFAQGNIDGGELALQLGENATGVVGATVGTIASTAALGAGVALASGTAPVAAGVAAALIGGMVGFTLATSAFQTAADLGQRGAEVLRARAEGIAQDTVAICEAYVPECVENVMAAINDYAIANGLDFSL